MRFILFDRVVELQKGHRATLLKNVTQSEDYFIDHFPGFPVVPGSIILGSFEQGAEMLLGASHDFSRLPVLQRLSKVSFRRFVVPGDQIEISLTLDPSLPSRVKALAQVQGRRVVEARLDFSLERPEGRPDLAAACDRLRRLYELVTSSPLANVWSLWEQQS